ncbi:MAG TPA: type II toxin-antitoxin system death-on-curing family toxin [Polyangiaceae bacterium]|nr:type II toxin-antitoxin system death-on-curing family toxin [Polyangiaceae bacterium]
MTAPEFLTVEDVELLHSEQLRLFGGLDGVRDRGALESAVAVPAASFGGEFLHVGLFAMAAAYAFHIAENQPFVDGNKRTALNAALVFLGLNGWDVDDPEGALYESMIGVSARTVSKEQLAGTLERLAVPYADD